MVIAFPISFVKVWGSNSNPLYVELVYHIDLYVSCHAVSFESSRSLIVSTPQQLFYAFSRTVLSELCWYDNIYNTIFPLEYWSSLIHQLRRLVNHRIGIKEKTRFGLQIQCLRHTWSTL